MPSKKKTTYSEYYGITDASLPFLDLNIYTDTPLFMDPHRIRMTKGPKPYQEMAVKALNSHLEALKKRVLAGENGDGGILEHINEPPETRLGMSASGCHGHGANTILSQDIWHAISTDLKAFWVLGILKQLEDLPMFVRGIADDITSDITTSVIFAALAEFTLDCMCRYPELSVKGVAEREFWVWDSDTCQWKHRKYKLPVIDGIAVILVPVGWVGKRVLSSSSLYFHHPVIEYRIDQEERQHPGPRLTKKEMERRMPGDRTHHNREITIEANNKHGINLVEEYWKYIDEREAKKDSQTD